MESKRTSLEWKTLKKKIQVEYIFSWYIFARVTLIAKEKYNKRKTAFFGWKNSYSTWKRQTDINKLLNTRKSYPSLIMASKNLKEKLNGQKNSFKRFMRSNILAKIAWLEWTTLGKHTWYLFDQKRKTTKKADVGFL